LAGAFYASVHQFIVRRIGTMKYHVEITEVLSRIVGCPSNDQQKSVALNS